MRVEIGRYGAALLEIDKRWNTASCFVEQKSQSTSTISDPSGTCVCCNRALGTSSMLSDVVSKGATCCKTTAYTNNCAKSSTHTVRISQQPDQHSTHLWQPIKRQITCRNTMSQQDIEVPAQQGNLLSFASLSQTQGPLPTACLAVDPPKPSSL